MLRVRLQRRGKKNYATYRVVIAEQHAPIKGRFIADVGSYNPHTSKLQVNQEAVTDWIKKGAQPTPTVHNLLVENDIVKGEKVTSWRPKKKATEDETGADQSKAEENADEAPAANKEADKAEAEEDTKEAAEKTSENDDKSA